MSIEVNLFFEKLFKFIFFLLISGFVFSGCGKIWTSVTYNNNQFPGSSEQTYEYIYFGDQNNANLPGYSINKSSGVLTAIPNTPAAWGGGLYLGKIAGDAQILAALGGGIGSAYLISPTTGILNPVTGTGFLSSNGGAVFSPSGLYIYSTKNTQNRGWIAQVSPTTGNFSNPVQTANFSAPITQSQFTLMSPDGNYVYFIDPTDNAIEGYSTSGGALTVVAGGDTGTGANVGDQTYGLTLLLIPPNAGNYSSAYLDSGAGVIYLYYSGTLGTDDNWIVPYKINADGSLSTATSVNIGTNPGFGPSEVVGDSTGKYLFVGIPGGTLGITTYSIGPDGTLTYSSGPVFAGKSFLNLLINSENTLIYGSGSRLVTASINMSNGILTTVSNIADPCGGTSGPSALDPSESFIYVILGTPAPNVVCGGFTVNSSGILGTISGQSYPLTIPGSASIISLITVQMTSP